MNSSLYPNPLLNRLRRNRKNASIRELVSETTLSASDLVYPVFLMEGKNTEEPIHSMPGISRKTIDLFLE
jgi:porphobilinogen synthase